MLITLNLGVKKDMSRKESKRWSELEISFLKENLKEMGIEWCSDKLGRSVGSIKVKKQCFAEIKNERVKSWKKDEIEFLKENFCKNGALYCSEFLSERTLESIRIKASRLGLIRNKGDRYNQEVREKKKNCPDGYCYCPSCEQILSKDFFYKKTSEGRYGDFLYESCRSCSKEKARRSFRKNKSSHRDRYQKNPEIKMYQNLKARAKNEGIKFEIDVEDIIIPETCPVLGIPLIPFSSSDNSPSVDKFYPEKGYIKGNIFIISKRANRIKSNAYSDEVEKLLNWMRLIESNIKD